MMAAMTPKETSMNQADLGALIAPVSAIARKAGDEILKIYGTDFAVRAKADASPVTDADEAAERIIVAELARITPDITIVSEEAAADKMPDAGSRYFWAVDPLDGTKEFVKRNGEFTVNIALIIDRRPVLGVLHAPALGLTCSAAGAGTAMCQEGDAPPRPIAARPAPSDGVVVISSRSHKTDAELERFLAEHKVKARMVCGSALKFCRLARGEADLYPRFGPCSEWDTAAGQAILEAAGGSVTTPDGGAFLYGKPGFLNSNFIARGKA
jgi:3'(2'), 5'-bisphosphate nucleotidase